MTNDIIFKHIVLNIWSLVINLISNFFPLFIVIARSVQRRFYLLFNASPRAKSKISYGARVSDEAIPEYVCGRATGSPPPSGSQRKFHFLFDELASLSRSR